jgi:hypothetical protein
MKTFSEIKVSECREEEREDKADSSLRLAAQRAAMSI